MKNSSNKIRNLMAAGMIATTVGQVALPITQVLAAETTDKTEEVSKDNSNDNPTVDPVSELTQVVSVNGNKLTKDAVVNPGDTVTFDIVYFPGNRGLMTGFTDTLPKGLKFNPNSKYATTVFAVNNDGTVGDEITDQGKAKLSGKTYSWIPNNPKDFFFVGKTGTQNRLLFHITTTVENGVEAGQLMKNVATGTIENPKKPGPIESKDEAVVRIPKDPKDPTIEKSVYLQDKDGNISLPLPGANNSEDNNSNSDDSNTDGDTDTEIKIDISTTDTVEKMKDSMNQLISIAEKYKVDTSKYKEDVTNLSEKATDDEKTAFVKEFTSLKEAINKAIEDGVKPVDPNENNNEGNNSSSSNDNVELPEHDSLYTYVVNATIPSQSIKKKLVIEDPIEHIQSFSLEDVTVYNGKGEDITKQGKVELKASKDKKTITWTASDDFISSLKKENKNRTIQVRVKNVTLKGANKDDEEKYVTGGRVTVPNIANLIWDDNTTPSNETIVRPPEDPNNPSTSIQKSVALQEGKLEPIVNPYQKDSDSNTKDENKTDEGNSSNNNESSNTNEVSDSRTKLEDLVKKAETWVKKDGLEENAVALVNSNIKSAKSILEDKNASDKDLNYYFNSLQDSLKKSGWTDTNESTTSKEENKTETPKAGDVVAKAIDFEKGSSSILLPSYDSYYKYMVEVSVNPNDVKKSLTIEDKMENIQAESISLDNVKLYDQNGSDVTDKFELSLDDKTSDTQVNVKAQANKDLVNSVHQSKENVKFQMVIYNVQLSKPNQEQSDRYTEDGQLKVPNVATIITDNKNIDSNKTIVTPGKTPTDPTKPDIKTGLENPMKNPITLLASLIVILSGIGAYFKFRKPKH